MRKRAVEEVEEGSPAWMTSFSDLMSLLLTFFILLFSMSIVDEVRLIQFLQSFGNPQINIIQDFTGEGFDETIEGAIGTEDPFMISPDDGRYEEQMAHGGEISEWFQALVIEFETHFIQMTNPFTHDGMGAANLQVSQGSGQGEFSGLEITVLEESLHIEFTSDMLFASGSAQLMPGVIDVLDQIAVILMDFPMFEITITGHTDNIPINTPIFPDNWMLSNARAHAVGVHFINNHGFPPDRVEMRGRGEHHPIATNQTAEGRAANRRVEITIEEITQ